MDDQTLRVLIDETINRAVSQVRLPKIRFGTTVDTTDLDNVTVLIDGDIAPIVAPSLIGPLYDNVRVAVLFNPPSGAIIMGYKYTGLIDQRGSSVWRTLDTTVESTVTVGQALGSDVGIWIRDANGDISFFFGTGDASNDSVSYVFPQAQMVAFNPDVFDGTPGRWPFWIDNGELKRPNLVTSWTPDINTAVDSGGRPTFTSGSYVTLYRAVHPAVTSQINTSVAIFPGSGNTVDVRIMCGPLNSPNTLLGQVTGVTGSGNLNGPWTIPANAVTVGQSHIGELMEFNIEGRRTAGASVAAVAPWYGLYNYAF